jgi:Putative Flp pilus-assembly TadE/G-like
MKSRHYRSQAHRQRGQAVVLFLAIVAACCCVFALVYNVGQVTNKKEETINAADAAALSGAVVEARMLNFQAYTNRAMVANEVTIAQLVSLDSFVRYNNQLFQNIATYTAAVPYLDDATQAAADASQILQEAVDPVVAATIPITEALNTELHGIQQAAYFAGALAAKEVSENVANANETTFNGRDDEQPTVTAGTAAFAINEASWLQFTTTADSAVAKNIVLESRDPFSTSRPNGVLLDAINTALEILGGGISYTVLDKTSGDTVLDGTNHWIAQDSLDLASGGVQFTLGIPTGYGVEVDPFSPPLGYGRADADSDGNTDHNLCNSTGFLGGPTVNCQLAQDNAQTFSYNGLPDFRDLAKNLSTTDPCSTNNASDSAALPYVMAVQRSGKSTQTTQRLGMNDVPDAASPEGSPQLTDNLQNGDNLTSISEACVFFYRPDFIDNGSGGNKDITAGALPRPDAQHEFASLYNPYWQARLTAADPKWTTLLFAIIQQPGLDQALNTPAP